MTNKGMNIKIFFKRMLKYAKSNTSLSAEALLDRKKDRTPTIKVDVQVPRIGDILPSSAAFLANIPM